MSKKKFVPLDNSQGLAALAGLRTAEVVKLESYRGGDKPQEQPPQTQEQRGG